MSDHEEQKSVVPEGNHEDYEEEQEAEQNSTAGHSHRKKRAFKKAPDAPKRFKSAYICFVKDKMDDVKKSLPADVKVTEVMKLLACMWKNLPPLERLEYDKIARADKSRYMEELQHYSGPMQVPNKRQKKPADAPRRGMSAFLSYSQEMRPKIRDIHPELKNTEISSILAHQWRAASDEDKRPHIEKELQQREKYYENMAKWKADEEVRKKSSNDSSLSGGPGCKTQLDFLDIGTASRENSEEFWSSIEHKHGSYEPNENEASSIDRMNQYLSDGGADESVTDFWDHAFEDTLDQSGFDGLESSPMTDFPDSSNPPDAAPRDLPVKTGVSSSSTEHTNQKSPNQRRSKRKTKDSPSCGSSDSTSHHSSKRKRSSADAEDGEDKDKDARSARKNAPSSTSSDAKNGHMGPPPPPAAFYFPLPAPSSSGSTGASEVSSSSDALAQSMLPSYALGFYLAKLQQQLQMEQQVHHHQQQQQQARHDEEIFAQQQQIDQQQRLLHDLFRESPINQRDQTVMRMNINERPSRVAEDAAALNTDGASDHEDLTSDTSSKRETTDIDMKDDGAGKRQNPPTEIIAKASSSGHKKGGATQNSDSATISFSSSQQSQKPFPPPPLYQQMQHPYLFPQLHLVPPQFQFLQPTAGMSMASAVSPTGNGDLSGPNAAVAAAMLAAATAALSQGLVPIPYPVSAANFVPSASLTHAVLNSLPPPLAIPPSEPVFRVESSLPSSASNTEAVTPATSSSSSASTSSASLTAPVDDTNKVNHEVLVNAPTLLKLALRVGYDEDVFRAGDTANDDRSETKL
eukprot:gene9432-6759_t